MICGLLGLVASAHLNAAALVQDTALDLTSVGSKIFSGNYTLGWSFTAHETLYVDALGQWDDLGNGLSQNAQIGIWDSNQNLLVSTTVGAGTAGSLDNGYRYNSVAVTELTAGETYFIGSYYLGNVMRSDYSGYSYSTSPLITLIEGRWHDGAFGFMEKTAASLAGVAYGGANFQFAAVPLPAAVWLFGSALAGLGWLKRKRPA